MVCVMHGVCVRGEGCPSRYVVNAKLYLRGMGSEV